MVTNLRTCKMAKSCDAVVNKTQTYLIQYLKNTHTNTLGGNIPNSETVEIGGLVWFYSFVFLSLYFSSNVLKYFPSRDVLTEVKCCPSHLCNDVNFPGWETNEPTTPKEEMNNGNNLLKTNIIIVFACLTFICKLFI